MAQKNFIINMKARKNILVVSLLFFMVVVLLTKFVSANFVCGEVKDAKDMDASWYSVRVFYPDDVDSFVSCSVSPAGDKYCCDTEAIPGKTWKIGDKVSAEIFDPISGYVAGPVSLTTSGEGYDVFPTMQLKKVIKIHNPKSKLIFSNESSILLNTSFEEPYNFIELEKGGSKTILCSNCSSISRNIEGNFGMNYFKLFASFADRIFSEEIIVAILKDFNFNRKIECRKCKGGIVKHKQIVNMSLVLNLSHYVEALELKEYVPVEWEILEADGEIEEYSESHNLIVWNVSGKNVVKNYVVKVPKIRFFPKKYIFRTELENETLAEDEIIVYRFFWFFPFNQEIMSIAKASKNKYSRIYPHRPLVKRFDNEIVRIAVFPNKIVRNAEFELINNTFEEDFNEHYEVINSYRFETNFEENIEKIFIEFKIKKKFLDIYKNVSLFVLNEENNGEGWQEVEIQPYREDGSYVYYKAFIKGKAIALAGEKKSFLEWLGF